MNKFHAANDTFEGAYNLNDWVKTNLPRLVKAFQALTQRATVTAPIALLRNVPAHVVDQVFGPVGSTVGKVFVERRFTSTTKHDHELGFGDVRFEYHLPVGYRALDVHHLGISQHGSEKEVILAPEQPFRVVSDTQEATSGYYGTQKRVIVLEGVTA
jgi:hypothetical protein